MSAARRFSKTRSQTNHQRSWIWGRHAVLEAVRSARWRPAEVHLVPDLEQGLFAEIKAICAEWDIPCLEESPKRLQQLCHADQHQGMIARMPEYPYLSLNQWLDNVSAGALYLILDELQDAFNFGATLRCAEVFGVDTVIVGQRNQSPVNSQVVRSSAGAVHHLSLVRHDNLTEAVQKLKASNVQVVGATEKADRELFAAKLTGPLALIIGNEGRGIAPERLALCDQTVLIPQSGKIDSLNAAVAAGILLYETVRQRVSNGNESK